MDACAHGMDRDWCYLCRVEGGGAGSSTLWGLDTLGEPAAPVEFRTGPMGETQADYLRFLCEEFGYGFEPDLTEGEADLLMESFLEEPMTERQRLTLGALCQVVGAPLETDLSYGEARGKVRRLFALRALRTTA